MPDILQLTDSTAVADITTLISRAIRLEADAVRVTAAERVVTITVPAITALGILDSTPTVLGMRVMVEHSGHTCDRIVSTRAVAERLARPSQLTDDGRVLFTLPDAEVHVPWAGTAVPRHGWVASGSVSANLLEAIAVEGIGEVAEALPAAAGSALIGKVRSQVWGGVDDRLDGLPRGTAFCATTLGFIPDPGESLRVFRSGRWARVSSRVGHVLVRTTDGW